MSKVQNWADTTNATAPQPARIAVAILFFLNGAMLASWAARIPAIQSKLALSPGQLGIALLGMSGGALVAMNLSGYLAARFGSKFVTTIAAICLCITLPLLALAPALPVLILALVLFGGSNGAMDVAMNAQGVAVEKGYRRPILNSFHAFYSFGALTGAFVGGLVASRGISPWPHFLSIAILCAASILIAFRFLLPASADAHGSSTSFARPTRALLALGLIAFCVLLGEGAIADWSALYLNGTLRTDAGLAVAGYAAFSIVMALGRGIGDQLTTRLGPKTMVRLGGLLAAVGLTIALLVTWVPLVLIGFGMVGAGFSVVFPLTLSAAGRTTGQASGTAIAAVATCGYIGLLAGPPIIGFAADLVGLRIALGFIVILSLLAALFASAVGNDKRPDEAQRAEVTERSEVLRS
jgi:MFS family permease